MLTVQEVAKALPSHLKTAATQDLVDTLNKLQIEPEAAEAIRDNFLSYAHVLKEGRFKMEDYLNAIGYVSFKLMGYSNKDAYAQVFPHRYEGMIARGVHEKDISAYVAAYHKNKLVTMILEQAIIPSWILNQDAYQKAINTQVHLMTHAKSEKVRADAANSILTHLKKPESKQMELAITTKDNSGLEELKSKMLELAQIQRSLIEGGAASTRDIAHQRIIEAEVAEVVAAEGEAE